jgi:hypothetical protein
VEPESLTDLVRDQVRQADRRIGKADRRSSKRSESVAEEADRLRKEARIARVPEARDGDTGDAPME